MSDCLIAVRLSNIGVKIPDDGSKAETRRS